MSLPWALVGLRASRYSVLRSAGAGARSAVPFSSALARSFASATRRGARSQPWRLAFGSLCVGAATVKGWRATQEVTPADAEDLRANYLQHQQEELDRISKKISWWRLAHLFFIGLPVFLVSPLWLVAPGYFWSIVASQIDRSGPCFIKLAQWLSTRRDVFSDELCESLSAMHDSVEAVWSAGICPKEIVRKLRGDHVCVKRIDDVAVAAGSIAEVYFGHLEDGTQIAVKCLRPGVRDLLEGDLAWMLYIGDLAGRIEKFAMLNLRRACEDFCEHIQMQVDFHVEASNLTRFRKNFAGSGEPVCFPDPLYVSEDLLVLTKESGDNLAQVFRDADAVSRRRRQAELMPTLTGALVSLGVQQAEPVRPESAGMRRRASGYNTAEEARFCSADQMSQLRSRSEDIQEVLSVPAQITRKISAEVMACYMRMVFNDAFIHGDLHPGNMMLRINDNAYVDDSNSARGTYVGGWKKQIVGMLPESIARLISDVKPPFELVLLDAGLAVPIAPHRVEALRAMAVAMLYCDFKGSATHIYNQSPDNSKCLDPEAFKEAMADVFRNVRKKSSDVGYVQVGDACLECLRLVRVHQVQLDSGLSWALFAMLSAEGSARQLDPLTDCTGAAARYIVSIPSLFREMKHQSPEVLYKMVRELVVGRHTHKTGCG